jgi:hypothetical protein
LAAILDKQSMGRDEKERTAYGWYNSGGSVMVVVRLAMIAECKVEIAFIEIKCFMLSAN